MGHTSREIDSDSEIISKAMFSIPLVLIRQRHLLVKIRQIFLNIEYRNAFKYQIPNLLPLKVKNGQF